MQTAIAGIGYEHKARHADVIRWLIIVFFALLIFSAFGPWLEKLGLGKLPGDLRFRLFGREWFVPFASSVLIGLIGLTIARFL